MGTLKFCPNCGKQVIYDCMPEAIKSKGVKHCPECGFEFSTNLTQTNSPSASNKNPKDAASDWAILAFSYARVEALKKRIGGLRMLMVALFILWPAITALLFIGTIFISFTLSISRITGADTQIVELLLIFADIVIIPLVIWNLHDRIDRHIWRLESGQIVRQTTIPDNRSAVARFFEWLSRRF